MYYQTLESFRKKYDALARKDRMDLRGKAEFLSWQQKAEKTLSSLLALDMLSLPSSLSPALLWRRKEEWGYMEKVTINTEDDVVMPMYILVPETATAATPVYLCPPGHMGGGKESVAGRRENKAVSEMIDHFNYDYALRLAKEGFVAVAFDSRGFGERREKAQEGEENILSGSCYNLSHMAEPLGFTLIGLLVWDMMRLADYIEERGEWGEIRALGFSGGGLQTLYATALDERIKMAFISGYFYGFKDSLLVLNGNCNCNYVPSLWRHFDIQDIAALIAPRPLVIQSAKGDHLNGERGIENVMESMAELKKAYSLLQSEDKLYHDIVEGPHHFDSENMGAAIRKVTCWN